MGKKSRRKIRVEFRKNRHRGVRENDLTRSLREDEQKLHDSAHRQRLSGKGDQTRHRTVMAEDHGSAQNANGPMQIGVDAENCRPGLVISSIGLKATVQFDSGERIGCTVRRLLRTLARRERTPVVAGDHVLVESVSPDEGVIVRVNPRKSSLTRGTDQKSHIIAANVDQALIVISAGLPDFKPQLLDRFLISAEKGGCASVIAISKVDLVDPLELVPMAGMYSQLGYPVIMTSTVLGRGWDELRQLLAGKVTVLAGQSGVGKSTLLNVIAPNLKLRTAAVSDETGKGKHTTRTAELLELPDGGWVIDTPGIRQLQLWDVRREEIEGYFIEFRPFVPRCKFPNCWHDLEEECAVRRAVERRLISRTRYDSYLRMLQDDEYAFRRPNSTVERDLNPE
ncbi:MAG: ribosome small subunit-dependent GTPase A [Planctomycetaceae bacterium]